MGGSVCGKGDCNANNAAKHVGNCPPSIFGVGVLEVCDYRGDKSDQPSQLRIGQYRCECSTSKTSLTKEIEMVARAKGSPMMLAILALLRLGAFMLRGFFRDGE